MISGWGAAAFLCLAPDSARALTVQELQAKMRESETGLEGLRFDYRQEMCSELTPEVKQSSGTAYVGRPRRIRIEQKFPSAQLIVSDGKSVYVYTPQFNQVIRDSWKKWFSKNVVFPGLPAFSDSTRILERDYAWEMLQDAELNGETMLRVRLSPSNGKGKGPVLGLWISGSDYIPRMAEWSSGTLSLITILNHVQRNPEMPAELFRFKKPERSRMIEAP